MKHTYVLISMVGNPLVLSQLEDSPQMKWMNLSLPDLVVWTLHQHGSIEMSDQLPCKVLITHRFHNNKCNWKPHLYCIEDKLVSEWFPYCSQYHETLNYSLYNTLKVSVLIEYKHVGVLNLYMALKSQPYDNIWTLSFPIGVCNEYMLCMF